MIHHHSLLVGKESMPQETWFDKYRIIKLLGQGGTAEVYLAEHIKLNTFRAIKHISKHHPLYKLQLKEAQILKDLKHSCIPIVYDIEEDEDGSYIVEQYLEGVTLKEYVTERNYLHDDIIIHFALQLCDLIKYLHSVKRPILYLDLKPDNIIVTDRTIKLIDFGSAMFRDEAETVTEHYGTIGYAAPELYGKASLDERCDVYGIGMLMYYMITGKTLSASGETTEHIDFINKSTKKLKRIISRCLRYNPSLRYASVSGLEQQLSAIIKKKKHFINPGSSIEIGIAGAQTRIGTTHMSIRLCSYLSKQNLKCLYIEQNKSRCLQHSGNRYMGLHKENGVIKMNGISMIDADNSKMMDLSGYNVVIRDYGSLNMSNKEHFLQSDIKVLILGAKDWELGYSEEALEIVSEYKDVIFLFNFVDGRQFRQVIKNMMCRNCLRIPYEPDPFALPKDKSSHEFFRELAVLFTL
ncbi:MAG: serine/threonine protein kinase [Anaerolineaceae bacterium]|nr:MAG: serine/threonine protein kinase [Anaerolineaceae bacterium]